MRDWLRKLMNWIEGNKGIRLLFSNFAKSIKGKYLRYIQPQFFARRSEMVLSWREILFLYNYKTNTQYDI